MSTNDLGNNVPVVEGKAADKKGARFLPKMNRLPTLEDLARRIVPGVAGTPESNATASTEAQNPEALVPRPRLSTSILSLSHRSQNRPASSTNADSPASEVGNLSANSAESSVVVVPPSGEEPPKDLAKDKIHRGYKNVPSLDAITERMRARAGSSSEAHVSSTTVAVAKLSINAPTDNGTVVSEQAASTSKSDTVSISKDDDKRAQEKARTSVGEKNPPENPDDNTHPLQFAWALYHDSRGRSFPPVTSPATTKGPSDDNEHYAAGLTVIGNFETVEDFCRYFNWLKPPSLLEAGSNYHLFKKGIQPMWEDAANANGGKWVITMKSNPELLDRCWSWLSMALVGEQIDERDEICGAVVSVRHKIDRIQVWTRSKDNVDLLNSIGKKLYKLLDLSNEPTIGLEFQFHSEDRPSRNKFIHVLPRMSGGVEGTAFHPAEGKGSGGWRGAGVGTGGAFGSFGRGGAFGGAGNTGKAAS